MSDIKPVVTAWLADLIVKDRRIAELEAQLEEQRKQESVVTVNVDDDGEEVELVSYKSGVLPFGIHKLYAAPMPLAHNDHPSRHWDRTCPACIAEGSKP